jgi:uncharacterized membrane protein YkvA (DUF1232 family)
MARKAPALFKSFQRRAGRLVSNPERLTRLLARAGTKMALTSSDAWVSLRTDLARLVALTRAWLSGEYRDVSTSTLISVVAAILYFVVPLDAIPDFIIGWGLVDDVAVAAYVIGIVSEELEKFERWRAQADAAKTKGAED